jgi:hypothetical protein
MPAAEEVIDQLVEARGDITLSLSCVLRGCIAEVGGESAFGQIIGRIITDPDVPIPSKVNLMNNMMKLMGQYGDTEKTNDLLTDEQITAKLKQLDEQE